MTPDLMIGALGVVLLLLLVGAVFSWKAGRNSARLNGADQLVDTTRQAARAVQNMAEAEAAKPATNEALLQRLDGGGA